MLKRPMYAILNDIDSFLDNAQENVCIVGNEEQGINSYPQLVLMNLAGNKAESALVANWMARRGGQPLRVQIYTHAVEGVMQFEPCKQVLVTDFIN